MMIRRILNEDGEMLVAMKAGESPVETHWWRERTEFRERTLG